MRETPWGVAARVRDLVAMARRFGVAEAVVIGSPTQGRGSFGGADLRGPRKIVAQRTRVLRAHDVVLFPRIAIPRCPPQLLPTSVLPLCVVLALTIHAAHVQLRCLLSGRADVVARLEYNVFVVDQGESMLHAPASTPQRRMHAAPSHSRRYPFDYLLPAGNGDSPSSFRNLLCFALDS